MAVRTELEILPEFSAELAEIRKNGITTDLLYQIIRKHQPNALYNRGLFSRYMAIGGSVPIFGRLPQYEEEEDPINNKVNNDFFGEIVDFKVGYFAGEPISYSYSNTKEAEEETGGEQAVDEATKALTDFTTRNNMFGVDMETTKYASIYGYAGRLFYIDKEGNERVMPVHGYETIILSDTDISEPEYAIRYYEVMNLDSSKSWVVDFYDQKNITTFKGDLLSLTQDGEPRPHFFDYCPLQGVANNRECLGDAEKVLALIDDYDKVLSDNSNEIEAFVHAMLLVNLNADDAVVKKAQKSGALIVPPVGANQNNDPVKWLTKNINDAFTEHHLQRVEDNIYRFSRTPNLGDESFGSASGISLKFKLHGLETKCSTFEANVMNSAQYMWKVLCSSWNKKNIKADPLQFVMEFHRNFPLDRLAEAQAAQAEIAAGFPKRFVYSRTAGVDDPDFLIEMAKEEKEDAMSLYESAQDMMKNGTLNTEPKDDEGNETKDDKTDEE
jgi:SPP1 family phage portal protein